MKNITMAIVMMVNFVACTQEFGAPIEEDQLGFRACHHYYDCGEGRFCTQQGYCRAECRHTADCRQRDEKKICNRFGNCLLPDAQRPCSNHTDCPPGRYCNGTCSQSQVGCGGQEICPENGEQCRGFCGAHCGSDNDCLQPETNLSCTPIGQCLQPGWEKWVDITTLPDTACQLDSQCKALGWGYHCDCEKSVDEKTKESICSGGAIAACKQMVDPDWGCGPSHQPQHPFCGVWGMRMVIATKTLGVPLVNTQLTYSSNLFLVKLSQPVENTLKMETKICDVRLINFTENDEPVNDLVWMVVPHTQLRFLPTLNQSAFFPKTADDTAFTTSQSIEVRGALLDNPAEDPLPTREDYQMDPKDPRFWDQDRDGKVGVTIWANGIIRGQVYNVIRWKALYRGDIVDADHLRGTAITENEQNLISASSDSLLYDTTTVLHEDSTRTYFRMQRQKLDTSCSELLRIADRNDSWLRHTNHLEDVQNP